MSATGRGAPAQSATADREIVISRVISAPRELVFEAFTEVRHLSRWWGPEGFTSPACTMDVRVGGRFLWCMRSAKGQEYWNTGVFREIVPLERLVYTDSFADPQGNVVPASHYGFTEPMPLESLITVTFAEQDGRTTMTVRHAMPPGRMADMTRAGWNTSFDKLAASLG